MICAKRSVDRKKLFFSILHTKKMKYTVVPESTPPYVHCSFMKDGRHHFYCAAPENDVDPCGSVTTKVVAGRQSTVYKMLCKNVNFVTENVIFSWD
jgi:hypothetical protein